MLCKLSGKKTKTTCEKLQKQLSILSRECKFQAKYNTSPELQIHERPDTATYYFCQ